MMRFMLKLQNEYSVIDAVEHALHIDENLWPQLVTSIDQLDVLHAGRVNPNLRIEGAQIRGSDRFRAAQLPGAVLRSFGKSGAVFARDHAGFASASCWCARRRFHRCTWRGKRSHFLKHAGSGLAACPSC